MKLDTPLWEVAKHLPPELMTLLIDKPAAVREKTLEAVRQSIVVMEQEGARLDPVSYRAVVFSMGIMAITAAEWGDALARIQTVIEKAKEK